MSKTGCVIDERYEAHLTPSGHPERPQRTRVLREWAESADGLTMLEAAPAAAEDILRVHTRELYDAVAATAGGDGVAFDSDTFACGDSHEAAMLASGAFLKIVSEVMSGNIQNGVALVRPPGHHAESDRVMGFCFFNHVAVAAEYLLEKHGLERILIVDWDVHHGNGTQRSFHGRGDVMYVSLHQHPFYPGTGAAGECGAGDGTGRTVNVPLPARCGDEVYCPAFADIVDPIARQFDPQFVLISAGFDAHVLDPLGEMQVTAAGFRFMTDVLMGIARDHADNRVAAVLEGGYSLEGLVDGVQALVAGLQENKPAAPPELPAALIPPLQNTIKVQKQFWDLP